MNRELLKRAIKKIVLQEITINANSVGTTDVMPADEKELAALGKAVKDANVEKRAGSSKITASGPKHQVALAKLAEDKYDVVSVTNGSDRRTAKNLSMKEVEEFIKKHAKDTEVSYVDAARAKSINGGKEVKKEDEKKEIAGGNKVSDTDEMEDTKEDTQLKIADDTTTKADEKVNKELAPVDDDTAAPLGGELVDKIEKIVDRVLKNKTKADSKTAYLKTDTSKESPDKLSVKVKETPALKGTEKPIGKPSPKKNK
jgi:hypothetical protein